DLWHSRRIKIVNGSKPSNPAGSAARQVEDIRSTPCRDLFPLTPALSQREKVNHSLRGEQSRHLGFPLRDARCSLSPREGRVRGNGAKYSLAYPTFPELWNWTSPPAEPKVS